MKLDKNFLIPFFLVLSIFTISVILRRAPFSMALGVLIFIIIPILVIQNKTNNDWGIMFLGGIPITLLFILLLIGLMSLANKFPWIKDILIWPCK